MMQAKAGYVNMVNVVYTRDRVPVTVYSRKPGKGLLLCARYNQVYPQMIRCCNSHLKHKHRLYTLFLGYNIHTVLTT